MCTWMSMSITGIVQDKVQGAAAYVAEKLDRDNKDKDKSYDR